MKSYKDIKVVILAGGFGSRLDNITKILPKPLVTIGKQPIIIHIMRIFINQGINNFYLATGYKSQEFLKFFMRNKINSIKVNKFKTISEFNYKLDNKICNIKLFNTGISTMTGGRVKAVSKNIDDKLFLLTYGDGLANVNIKKLIKFHIKNKKLVTVTAVNPPARFGELNIKGSRVVSFSEKKPINKAWINGGFFVINKKFMNFIKNNKTILERDPLEKLARINQLSAYKHLGFWQCMDTRRDRDQLIKLINKNKYPWLNI
jgi:glucose-1-phosphate cytidylyltransferase